MVVENYPKGIRLKLLEARYVICKLPAWSPIPDWVQPGELFALVRAPDELSILCQEDFVPSAIKAERGWRALQVQGPLDFSLTGILAAVAMPLAQAGISIFAISSYNTDYILVKEDMLSSTFQALQAAGQIVVNLPYDQ